MSVTANRALIPLIYRHLKEHGFHSAAEELQRQSPQNEAPTSLSLKDIYCSWLKFSNRKIKYAIPKRSSPEKKQTTSNKAAQKKQPTQKSGSLYKKGNGKATEKSDKSNKSKTKNKKAVDGEDSDSDSDSSLDIEKWKKLVQEMTDTDIAKLDSINALTAPEPKKQRVRKPRAKPNPKPETQNNGMVQIPPSETSKKSTKDVLAKSIKIKTSRPKQKAPVSALVDQNQEENINVEAQVTAVTSTSKQSAKKEKRKAPMDQPSLKKKRKKEAANHNVEESGTNRDGLIDKSIINMTFIPTKGNISEKGQVNTANVETEAKKKKKGKIGDGVDTPNKKVLYEKNIQSSANDKIEAINNNQTAENRTETSSFNTANVNIESIVKKPKKKKKDKAKDDGDSVIKADVKTDTVIRERISDFFFKKNIQDTEEIVAKKKKKKKDKAKCDGDSERRVPEGDAMMDTVISEKMSENTLEETLQETEEIVTKKNKKKKDKKKVEPETLEHLEENVTNETVCVDNSEQIFFKKKSKKKNREGTEEAITAATTESCDKNELVVQTPEPTSTPQTPGSTKKKKSKIATKEATSQILEGETPKKKKKKSSTNNKNS